MAHQLNGESWLYPDHVVAMPIAGETQWPQFWQCATPPLQLAELTKFDDDVAIAQGTTHSFDLSMLSSCAPSDLSPPRAPPATPVTPATPTSIYSSTSTSFSGNYYTPPRTPPVDEVPLFPGIYSDFPRIHPSGPDRGVLKEDPEDVAQRVFPHPEQQELKVRLLRDVLETAWWQHNEAEPKGVYSQFIRRINNKLFECLSCAKRLKRQDRTIDHFRTHVAHRPFRCDGTQGCGDRHCRLSFFTRDCLKSHCSKHEKECDNCGAKVEDKNLNRHQATRKCKQARRNRLLNH